MCLGLSSVDKMPLSSISESYASDDALTKLGIIYETIDIDYDENKNDDNKNKDYEENNHIIDHSLEAKSAIIEQPKLFKTKPRLAVKSSLVQLTGPTDDVLSYEQLSKPIIPPKFENQFFNLSGKFYYSNQILLMYFN